jgi:membrane protease YdiL (CAAX protease family)
LKDLGKILAYFIAVIVLGALLAPPLYWAGQAVAARGVLRFLAVTDFQKFFNRGVLIAALALIWPAIRWLCVGTVSELGLQSDPRWWRRCLAGFVIAAIVVAMLSGGYLLAGVYHLKDSPRPWGRVPIILLSAFVVAALEESLFRAGILGLFRRNLSARAAILWTSVIFAGVHFLKPDETVKLTQINWLSGFELIPHVFHQFTEPLLLLGGFTTILVLALMLGDVTVRTRSLWMAIGLHAGVVFVKMSFSKFTKRDTACLPWIGEELQIGLIPVIALLLGWLLAYLWLRHVDRPAPAPRD